MSTEKILSREALIIRRREWKDNRKRARTGVVTLPYVEGYSASALSEKIVGKQ